MEIIVDYLRAKYERSSGWSFEARGRVKDPQIRTNFTVVKDKSHPIDLRFSNSEAVSSLSEVARRKLALDVRETVYTKLKPQLQEFVDGLSNLPRPRSPRYPLNN